MNNFLKHTLFLTSIINLCFLQVKPNTAPISLKENQTILQESSHIIHQLGKSIQLEINNSHSIYQQLINLNDNNHYFFKIETDSFNENDKLFIINKDTKSYIGPYSKEDFNNGSLKTDLIKGKNIVGTWGGETSPEKDTRYYIKKFIKFFFYSSSI